MSLCANIKFHGYLIVVFSALLTITVLISSIALKCIYPNREDATIPNDFQDLIDYGWFDFTGDIVHLISIGVLFYGIKKENRFCLIPFLISIVFDWIAYLITNTRNGSALPYQVWLVTTALFLYVFVTLIGLYKYFQIKLKEGTNRSDEFNKTMCL
uniref:EXPERA domain-containing protein n=1 Tax=Anopheles minimus TaxID=112268 RepID=A0A182WJJ0_9DIPT